VRLARLLRGRGRGSARGFRGCRGTGGSRESCATGRLEPSRPEPRGLLEVEPQVGGRSARFGRHGLAVGAQTSQEIPRTRQRQIRSQRLAFASQAMAARLGAATAQHLAPQPQASTSPVGEVRACQPFCTQQQCASVKCLFDPGPPPGLWTQVRGRFRVSSGGVVVRGTIRRAHHTAGRTRKLPRTWGPEHRDWGPMVPQSGGGRRSRRPS
jgi:hypothetical protein